MCVDETTNFLRLRSSSRRFKEVSREEHLASLNKGDAEDKKENDCLVCRATADAQ